MSSKRKTVKGVLNAAADLIVLNGHCKHDLKRKIGNKTHYCLIGALSKVSATGRVLQRAIAKLAVHPSIIDYSTLAYWNDRRYTRKNDVIRVLRETAEHL